MAAHFKLKQFIFGGMFFLFTACSTGVQKPIDLNAVEHQVATSVAKTIEAIQITPSITYTPLLSTPEAVLTVNGVTPTLALENTTVAPVVVTVMTAIPEYACDIINQRPFDDAQFHPNDEFDIKWTIVNTGTKKWEDETYLIYQSGPHMTEKKQVKLPMLKPREQYQVVFDAIAPSERERQIMVWAIKGPDAKGKLSTIQWMCYPYVRIIVK